MKIVTNMPWVEQLEQRRLLAGFELQVSARTGDVSVDGDTLSDIRLVSIANNAQAAFSAGIGSASGIFVTPAEYGTGAADRVSGSVDSRRTYSSPQINNSNKVVFSTRFNSTSGVFETVEVFDVPAGSSRLIVSDTTAQQPAPGGLGRYNKVYNPSIADDGTVVYVGDATTSFGNTTTATFLLGPADARGSERINEEFSASFSAGQPRLGDGENLAIYDTFLERLLFQDDVLAVALGTAFPWSQLGSNPGVSDDGSLAVFYGNLTPGGATNLGLTSGPGIFVASDTGFGVKISRVAGVSNNGQLDPGETYTDTNTNGTFDAGVDIDLGAFSGFIPNEPLGAARPTAGVNGYKLALVANGAAGGPKGLYTINISTSGGAVATVEQVDKVVDVGANLPGIGAITNIRLSDPINNEGELAFAVNHATGSAVVLGKPKDSSVLVVATHGFGADARVDFGPFGVADVPIFGTTTFRAPFTEMIDAFTNMPEAGSVFEDQIEGFAPSWESSNGWVEGIALRGLQIASAASLLAGGAGFVFRLAATFVLGEVAEAAMAKAARTAEETALEIANRVSAEIPNPADTQSGDQKIMLVGHSRGGAVNSRAAQLLVNRGYKIEEFVALDGYSSDWPYPGPVLADIAIDPTIASVRSGIVRSTNYRVQNGLEVVVAQGIRGFYNSFAQQLSPGLTVEESTVSALANVWAGIRAPDRPNFDRNEVLVSFANTRPGLSGQTNHINVNQYYLESGKTTSSPPRKYIEDNFIGENKDTPAFTSIASSVPDAATSSTTAAVSPRSETFAGVVDGTFQFVGPLSAEAATADFEDFGDTGLANVLNAIRNPIFLLSRNWETGGNLALQQAGSDWSVKLTSAASNATHLGQRMLVPTTATQLRFDMQVPNAGSGERLQVTLDGATLADIPLAGAANGIRTINLPANSAGTYADLDFRLIGANAGGAVVLDDIILGAPDTTAPTGTDGEFDVDAVRPQVRLSFSEDVSNSFTPSDIQLRNLTTGVTYPSTSLDVRFTPGTNDAVVRLNGSLPTDGNYRLTIPASAVTDLAGNALSAPVNVDFFVLGGDANRDRVVNVSDLGALSANFRGTGKTYSQGDFNYDGKVDVTDLGILSSNFRRTLPASSSVASVRTTPLPHAGRTPFSSSRVPLGVLDDTGGSVLGLQAQVL